MAHQLIKILKPVDISCFFFQNYLLDFQKYKIPTSTVNIGISSNTIAELWAIWRGLEIAWNEGYQKGGV